MSAVFAIWIALALSASAIVIGAVVVFIRRSRIDPPHPYRRRRTQLVNVERRRAKP